MPIRATKGDGEGLLFVAEVALVALLLFSLLLLSLSLLWSLLLSLLLLSLLLSGGRW